MPQLTGEYECKIDTKGRMRLPTPLLKQLGGAGEPHTFVINRGIEKCLTLYPKAVWDQISKKVNKLNTFKKKNRDFIRYFYRGATEMQSDASDRILLTKRLMEYAGIESDVVLTAVNDRVEIWAGENYEKLIEEEPEDFNELAEEVMGGENSGPDIEDES